jgi:HPt (histidine-containing phosphotransfer) domain-containing protein
MQEKPLYNFDKLKEIDDSEDFIHQVISIFLETVPANTEAMVKACCEEDWEQVYFFAHKIKSNVNLLSVGSITEEVKFVEQSAKDRNNLELLSEKIKHIDETVKLVSVQIVSGMSQ